MDCLQSGHYFKCPHYRTYWNWYNDSGSMCDFCFEDPEDDNPSFEEDSENDR